MSVGNAKEGFQLLQTRQPNRLFLPLEGKKQFSPQCSLHSLQLTNNNISYVSSQVGFGKDRVYTYFIPTSLSRNHYFTIEFLTKKCSVAIPTDIFIESMGKEKIVVVFTRKKIRKLPNVPTMHFPSELVWWELGGKIIFDNTNSH